MEEKKAICEYIKTKQALYTEWENTKYKKHQGKKPTRKANLLPKPGSTEIKFSSPRIKKQLARESKWNLAPLILLEEKQPLLEQATMRLLQELYGHTSFWREGLEKELISYWEQHKEELSSIQQFSDLFPEDLSLQLPFYKMLKGSGSYNLSSHTGYPPLKDIFCVDVEKPTTLYFAYASPFALTALLGKEVTLEILALEEKLSKEKKSKFAALSKADFFLLLANKSNSLSQSSLEGLFLFDHPTPFTEEILKQDRDENIRLQLPLR